MKKNDSLRPARLALALTGCLVAGSAWSATIATSPDPASIPQTGSTDVAIVYTASAGVTAFSGALTYDTTQFNATAVGASGVTCQVNDAFSGTEGRVAVAAFSLSGDLPSGTLCTVTFTTASATLGDYPLTFFNPVFGGSGGGDTVDNGLLTVSAAPPDANVTYSPVSGSTITFTGGTSGTSTNQSITVGATGTNGTATVSGCTLGGANPGAFQVAGTPITVAPGATDTIDLTCNLGNTAATATLTCNETDANGGTGTFSLSCPAGTPVPAPEFTSTPASGGTVSCNGAPGSTTSTSITIQNTGFVGAGSDLTYSCSTASAGFAITSGAGDTLAVGDSATVVVSCTVPADGTATGTVNCTSDDADEPTATYTVSAGAVTVPPPVPGAELIPANSLWSKLALFGLLAGLGALVIGMRRH